MMTNDKIFEIARHCCFQHLKDVVTGQNIFHAVNKDNMTPDLIKFARTIEAHAMESHKEERNKIELWRGLALCREGDGRAIAQIEKEAAAKEREACELACENEKMRLANRQDNTKDFDLCIAAIRARGLQNV